MIFEFDVTTCTVRHVYRDKDLFGGIVLCVNGNFMAIGWFRGDWVISRDATGVLSVYETPTERTTKAGAENSREIVALKAVKNLVTAVSSVAINNDNSLLVYASREKQTQIRAVHLGTRSVFTNWPTKRENLGGVTTVAMSGDNRGNGDEE